MRSLKMPDRISISLLPVLASLFTATNAQAKMTEERFLQNMVAHKMGVELFCEAGLSLMPTIHADYIRERCRRHDSAKVVQDRDFVEKHGISKEKSIAKGLSEIDGKFIPEDLAHRGIIDETNRVDNAVIREINAKHKVTPVQRRLADLYEHVIDLTERGLHERWFPPADGVYERGKPMSLASEYIATNPVEAKAWTATERDLMVKIAKKLEGDPTLKEKLVKLIEPKNVAERVRDILTSSHYPNPVRLRAECFEAMLHSSLPAP